MELNLLSSILLRIADPVEPLDFQFVQNDLPLPLFDGLHNRAGKQAGLFDHLNEGQANKL